MHDVWDGWITRCLSFSCDFCVTSEKYTEIIIINNRIHHYFFMSIIFICLIFLKHHTLLMVVHGVPWIFMCVCVHLILDIGLNFHTSAFSLCFVLGQQLYSFFFFAVSETPAAAPGMFYHLPYSFSTLLYFDVFFHARISFQITKRVTCFVFFCPIIKLLIWYYRQ